MVNIHYSIVQLKIIYIMINTIMMMKPFLLMEQMAQENVKYFIIRENIMSVKTHIILNLVNKKY